MSIVNDMLTTLRNYLADHPEYFTIVRKIIELNFKKQKSIVREVFGNATGKSILDIGCGTGEFAPLFQGASYFGIDITEQYIAYAAAHRPGTFQIMDATQLKFPNASFDGVLIMAILHHLDDESAQRVLKEAFRVLKPNGKILIMEDAKIPELSNMLVNKLQSLDKGDFIRPVHLYQKLIQKYFTPNKEWRFRNGGCVYYGVVSERKA